MIRHDLGKDYFVPEVFFYFNKVAMVSIEADENAHS